MTYKPSAVNEMSNVLASAVVVLKFEGGDDGKCRAQAVIYNGLRNSGKVCPAAGLIKVDWQNLSQFCLVTISELLIVDVQIEATRQGNLSDNVT